MSCLLPVPFMKRNCGTLLVLWLVIGAVSSLPAVLAQDKPASAGSGPSQGSQLFSANCAGCHGLDGRGGQRAPDIAGNAKLQKASNSEIQKIILEGVPGTGMPGFRSLGQAKIQSLVQHIRLLQGMDSRSALPGSPKTGKVLFFGKAGCSECHMSNGTGGFLGSDLSVYARGKSASEIREALTNVASLQSTARSVIVTTADGAKVNGIVRNEDNFSLQLQTTDGTFHFLDKSSVQHVERRTEPLMPTDYGTRLSAQELNDIVSYLIDLARSTSSLQRSGKNGRESRRSGE
jgi:cytochrome c oxidase cbb3-type subunit III